MVHLKYLASTINKQIEQNKSILRKFCCCHFAKVKLYCSRVTNEEKNFISTSFNAMKKSDVENKFQSPKLSQQTNKEISFKR